MPRDPTEGTPQEREVGVGGGGGGGEGGGEGEALPVAVHIQSREPTLLRFLRRQSPNLPLIQVLDVDWDQVRSPGPNPPLLPVYTTVHSLLYTVYCTLFTVCCLLYTVHCTLFVLEWRDKCC